MVAKKTSKTTSKKPVAKKAAPKAAKKSIKNAVKKVAKSPAKKTTAKKTSAKKPAAKKAAPKSTSKKVATKAPTKKAASAKKAPIEKKVEKKVAKKPDVFRCPISGIPVKPEKPNLSEKTLIKLKEILLEERQKHLDQAAELEAEAVALVADREGGDTQFDEESGEGDSVAVERERTLFLSAESLQTVEEIDKALERMKNKTYGLCTPSSRRINVARLEALPWTTVCVDCKARSERPR